MTLISMSVKKRKSRHFNKIEQTFRMMPNFQEQLGKYIYFEIIDFDDFWKNYQEIEMLYDTLVKWKDVRITIFEKEIPFRYKIYFRELESYVRNNYAFLPSSDFTIEDNLPMKYVFYDWWACFFVFMDKKDTSAYYFCDCQKNAVMESMRLFDNMRLNFPDFVCKDYEISDRKENFFDGKFKKNLCFTCNGSSSIRSFCNRMYGSRFLQDYGWYVYSRAYEKGINPWCDNEGLREVENEVRENYGYHKIGEKWISETKMYTLIKEIFPEEEVIFHYRSEWLSYLEIDVYIPRLKLGFEYQGKQHFEPVNFFGGESSFNIQRANDKKKEKICNDNGVKLIKVNYDDPLTKRFIKQLIAPS